jgi:hypothetical protein
MPRTSHDFGAVYPAWRYRFRTKGGHASAVSGRIASRHEGTSRRGHQPRRARRQSPDRVLARRPGQSLVRVQADRPPISRTAPRPRYSSPHDNHRNVAPCRPAWQEFRQGLGREGHRDRNGRSGETQALPGIFCCGCRHRTGGLTGSAGARRGARETGLLQGFSSGPRLGERDQIAPKPPRAPSLRARKNPAFAGLLSGRSDLNRGPHRPELWAKSGGAVRSPCKSTVPV